MIIYGDAGYASGTGTFMRNLSREMLIKAFSSSSVTVQLGPRASGCKVFADCSKLVHTSTVYK